MNSKANERDQRKSIYTLAAELQLNPGTVSRALRNRPEVAEKTRMLVQKRAAELGFKLRRFENQTVNICALIQVLREQETVFSSYIDAILDGIWRYCNQNDLELSLFSGTVEKLNSRSMVRQLMSRGASGAVLLCATEESAFIPDLIKAAFPFCAVTTGPRLAEPWVLRVDEEHLAEKATSHLIQLGHKHIAFLYSMAEFDNGRRRLVGYKNALKKAGLGEFPGLICSTQNLSLPCCDGFAFGSAATQKILSHTPRPTALLASSGECAIGAMQALQKTRKAVPRDMSIICFDDIRLAAYTSPPLSVVSNNISEMGFKAASLVHQRILNPGFSIPEGFQFDHSGDLLLRESCAPPRA